MSGVLTKAHFLGDVNFYKPHYTLPPKWAGRRLAARYPLKNSLLIARRLIGPQLANLKGVALIPPPASSWPRPISRSQTAPSGPSIMQFISGCSPS